MCKDVYVLAVNTYGAHDPATDILERIWGWCTAVSCLEVPMEARNILLEGVKGSFVVRSAVTLDVEAFCLDVLAGVF